MTQLGIVNEGDGETRVSATPETVGKLLALGYDVVVEKGAGSRSSCPDEQFEKAGARLVTRKVAWASSIVMKVNAPTDAEIELLEPKTTLISLLTPALRPELLEALSKRGVTAIALDAVPRISRAQSMDVLSSMANLAGYRAVIESANEFGRLFTGQVTAAGKVPPAKVLVAGAGVAGLAAIGAASSMGAIVRATDPRPEVADQVRSIGGDYIAVEVEEKMTSSDGYAKATSEAYDRRAAEIYSEQAREVDIIITTALIPGRPAPKLLTAADVASMRPGSVIVDMAAGMGGNVAGSVAGKRIVTDNGVVIHYVANNPGGKFKTVADTEFVPEQYGIALKKGNAELLGKLNQGLAAIKADGTYNQIYAKYFGAPPAAAAPAPALGQDNAAVPAEWLDE
jgi:NAD(P) transhydrogenase subunit alpha